MNTPTLTSTFIFTLLSLIGLVFFIRASVKERIQTLQFIADSPEDSLLNQLQAYFLERAYQISSVDVEEKQIIFQGFVRPSKFMAIFLTLLAILGLFCLILVLSFIHPSLSLGFFGLVLIAPIAGLFYWNKAGRVEKICLKIAPSPMNKPETSRLISVTAHRDELNELKRSFNLDWITGADH